MGVWDVGWGFIGWLAVGLMLNGKPRMPRKELSTAGKGTLTSTPLMRV
jgi:hypothetical protein